MGWKLGELSEQRIKTLRPELQKIALLAAQLSPSPFQVVQGARTIKQQQDLYAQGRTRPGNIVTYTLNSKHLGGRALDFAAIDSRGAISWDEDLYPPIAAAFQAASKQLGVGIMWGGEWRTKDWGHIELNPARNHTPPEAHSTPVAAEDPTMVVPTNTDPSDPLAPPGRLSDETRIQWAVRYLEWLGYPRHQAIAIIAHGAWESGGWAKSRDVATTALGDKGTAHGGWQWRSDRYSGKHGLLSFALTNCPGHSSSELEVQMRFIDYELRNNERRVGHLLQEAGTLEDAVKAFMGYLRPVGFKWDNPTAGHGYERRLKIAREIERDVTGTD